MSSPGGIEFDQNDREDNRMAVDIDDILQELDNQTKSVSDRKDEQARNDIEKLFKAWIAERTSPEILPFLGPVLEGVMTRVTEQIEFIEENSMAERVDRDLKFKMLVVESELERVKYLIRSYLRARLAKIDKYCLYTIRSKRTSDRLSPSELTYLRRHVDLLRRLYHTQFISEFPEGSRSLVETTVNDIPMIEQPDLDHAVFIRIIGDDGAKIRIGQEDIYPEKGNIYVIRYSAIKSLIMAGSAELI